MKKNSVGVWANSWQRKLIRARAKNKTSICGRGTGKTTGFGWTDYHRLKFLPRARGFMGALTYKQILNSSLPAMMKLWSLLGLEEYDWKTKRGHYVIGQRPPAHFAKPYAAPREFEHVITFYTGLTIDLLSLDRPQINRGGSFDFCNLDEISLIKQDVVERVLIPMVRGGEDIYGTNNLWHGTINQVGSMPWLSTGMWVLEYEQRAIDHPDLFWWSEATALCNLSVLGKNWMDMQMALLTPEVFQVEILNQRKQKATNQFYYNFNDVKHTYHPIINYLADPVGPGMIVGHGNDYSTDQLIDVAFDFGGWFTGALCFQQTHDRRISPSDRAHV